MPGRLPRRRGAGRMAAGAAAGKGGGRQAAFALPVMVGGIRREKNILISDVYGLIYPEGEFFA